MDLALADNGKWKRIAKAINLFWGTRECYNYIFNLMFDSRDGKREGFPDHIHKIITALSIEHSRYYDPPDIDNNYGKKF